MLLFLYKDGLLITGSSSVLMAYPSKNKLGFLGSQKKPWLDPSSFKTKL